MQIEYFTIAGGNKTALVWDCPENERLVKATELLSAVEQVGFVTDGERPHLLMMGGELCINALLALASQLKNEIGILSTSNQSEITYRNYDNKTRIEINLPHEIEDNVILLDGIGFVCAHTDTPLSYLLNAYAQKYNRPAFGELVYDAAGRISPRIHVVHTDSIVDETACGSGSVAAHLVTGHNDIIQPTGGIIVVHSDGETFSIEAAVSRLA